MGLCEGKLLVFVTLFRWLWIVVDHCGLVPAGFGLFWVGLGCCRSFPTVPCSKEVFHYIANVSGKQLQHSCYQLSF